MLFTLSTLLKKALCTIPFLRRSYLQTIKENLSLLCAALEKMLQLLELDALVASGRIFIHQIHG